MDTTGQQGPNMKRAALHAVASHGTPGSITALLEAGASGSVKDIYGRTPFDVARGNDKVKETAAYWALNLSLIHI